MRERRERNGAVEEYQEKNCQENGTEYQKASKKEKEKIIDELNQADFNGERTVELKPLPDNIGNRIAQAAETVEMWRKRR